MGIPLYQVDAFTHSPFKGNPAAVCVLREAQTDTWMSSIAAEMNLSETAFILPQPDGYQLRWFTPKVEVSMCGHATLASAHVLWENGYAPKDRSICFHTKSGNLLAAWREGWIELDFPAREYPEQIHDIEIGAALGVRFTALFKQHAKASYLGEVASEGDVRRIQPDFHHLTQLGLRSIIVTTRAEQPGYDIVSRFFAPGIGINEDPVTGSAHCALGPYWSEKLGKRDLVAYQASPRGGMLRIGVRGERVLLTGEAVTVFKGELVEV